MKKYTSHQWKCTALIFALLLHTSFFLSAEENDPQKEFPCIANPVVHQSWCREQAKSTRYKTSDDVRIGDSDEKLDEVDGALQQLSTPGLVDNRVLNILQFSEWISALKLSGDFRARYDFIDNQDSTDEERHRLRLRARLGLEVDFCDCVELYLRLASGGDDPVSTNQTLQDCFSSKDMRIDRAYAVFFLPCYPDYRLSIGKIKNPHWEPSLISPMIYDQDLNPEGISLSFQHSTTSNNTLSGYVSWYIIDELSALREDPWMLDCMLKLQTKHACIDSTYSLSFYFTENLPLADCQEYLGNYGQAGAGPTSWIGEFASLRLFAQWAYLHNDCAYLCTPALLTLSLGYAKNLSNDYAIDGLSDERQAWTAQLQYGKAQLPCSWECAVQYRYLEADALIDRFVDSDSGRGETNRKGWIARARWAPYEWWMFEVKANRTRRITDRGSDRRELQSNGSYVNRVFIDTVLRF